MRTALTRMAGRSAALAVISLATLELAVAGVVIGLPPVGLPAVAGAATAPAAAAPAAAPPADPIAFARWLDGLYYSEPKAGLKDLSAQVAVFPLWDHLKDRGITLDVTYYWKLPYREAIAVKTGGSIPADLEERIERLLLRRELLVNAPVDRDLERFTFTLRREGALFVLTGKPKNERSPIASREQFVDVSGRIIRVVVTQDDSDTFDRALRLASIDGKLAVVGYTGTADTPDGKVPITGQTTRARFGPVWLATEIMSRIGERTMTYRFSSHKVNAGVPDSVFR